MPRIFFTCAGCRLVLCPSCAARPPPVHPELFVCVECALRGVELPAAGAGSASQRGQSGSGWSLGPTPWRRRAFPRGAYNGAVADFVDFCRGRGVEPLPAQSEAVRAHVFHCTADRGHRLWRAACLGLGTGMVASRVPWCAWGAQLWGTVGEQLWGTPARQPWLRSCWRWCGGNAGPATGGGFL